jgi:hypothetical protein
LLTDNRVLLLLSYDISSSILCLLFGGVHQLSGASRATQ